MSKVHHPGGLPSPVEIVSALDRVIVGQDNAKRALALAAYRHYLGLECEHSGTDSAFGKQHTLLLGPTGCGKTQLVRELGRVLGVPVGMFSATSYAEAGYAGDQVENIVRALCLNTGSVAAAERSMVFIDEICKTKRTPGTRDVSGAGVQNALLKLLDGVGVCVKSDDTVKWVQTDRIFFVFAGAFDGLDDIVQTRVDGPKGIGFGNEHALGSPDGVERNAACIEDLIKFGMVREFVGRLATIAAVEPLDVDVLERILVEPQHSWLRRTQAFFAAHGTDLHLSRGAIRALAERAAEHGTGARALDRVASSALDPTVWRFLQANGPINRIDVNRTTIERGAQARFRPGTRQDVDEDGSQLAPVRIAQTNEVKPMGGTSRWNVAELDRIERTLSLEHAAKPAQNWWQNVRDAHSHDPAGLHDVAQQLVDREATIDELFTASVFAQTKDLRAVLHYLDYKRIRDREEKQQKAEK